jgi:glycosyltransferase involved in cell wall biosynthesis
MNSNRLRVAHVTPGLNVGGLEKLLVELACHADREQFELTFVSLGNRGELADEIEACGWPVIALQEPTGLRPGMVMRLARLFRELAIDVVHTHNDRPLVYAPLAARLAGVKRVIHTKHGRGYGLTRRQMALVNLAARWTHEFVCVSRDSARLCRSAGLVGRPVRKIWNGIDLSRFTFSGPRPGGPAVVVARLSPEKDLETLLHATALVVAEHPAFRLEIAGDGPCLPALRQLAEYLALEEHVRFLGTVRDIRGLLARAGLFVLSSVSEGLSLTLLEAMASGLPVVATRVGGNPEVVIHGETGLLVPARDPAFFAQAILQLVQDEELGRQMGRDGRRRAERYFDVRSMVAGYERLYQQVREAAVLSDRAAV